MTFCDLYDCLDLIWFLNFFYSTIFSCVLMEQVYPNLRSAMLGIYQRRGVLGFYAGLTPTLIEIVPYAGLQFGFYDSFQRWAYVSNLNMLYHVQS